MSMLTTSLSGLMAAQRSLEAVQHNIANVNTEGYSRQSVQLATKPSLDSNYGFVGQGVDVVNVTRSYDQFITKQLNTSISSYNNVDHFHQLATNVDNILADPTTGIAPVVKQFFNAANEVANDPTSIPSRQVLLSQVGVLTDSFNTMNGKFEEMRTLNNSDIGSMVNNINTLASSIADLNVQISAELGKSEGLIKPNDLLDKQDALLAKLAEIVNVTVIPQNDGTSSVFIGSGQALVLRGGASTFSTLPSPLDPTKLDIAIKTATTTTDITSQISGGMLAGSLRFRDEVLDPAQQELGRVAAGLAMEVNALQKRGFDLKGVAGTDLFNFSGTEIPVTQDTLNTGNALVTANYQDVNVRPSAAANLDYSDFTLKYVSATGPVNYTLTRARDNQVINLTANNTSSTAPSGSFTNVALGAGQAYSVSITSTNGTPGTVALFSQTGGAVNAASIDAALIANTAALSAIGITYTGTAATGDLVFNDITGNPITTNVLNQSGASGFAATPLGTGAAVVVQSVITPANSISTLSFAPLANQPANFNPAEFDMTTTISPGTFTQVLADGTVAVPHEETFGTYTPAVNAAPIAATTAIPGFFSNVTLGAGQTYSIGITSTNGTPGTVNLFSQTGGGPINATTIDAALVANTAALSAIGITYTGTATTGDLVFNDITGNQITTNVLNQSGAGGFAGAPLGTGAAVAVQNATTANGVVGVASGPFTMNIDGIPFYTKPGSIGATVTGADLDTALTAFLAVPANALLYQKVSGSFASNNLRLSKLDGTPAPIALNITSNFATTAGSFSPSTVNVTGTPAVASTVSPFTLKVDGLQIYTEAAAPGGTVTKGELDTALNTFLTSGAGLGKYTKTGSFANNDLVLSKLDGTASSLVITSNFAGANSTPGSFSGASTVNGTLASPAGIDLKIDLTNRAILVGDQFLVRPTYAAAEKIRVNIDDPTKIAAATNIEIDPVTQLPVSVIKGPMPSDNRNAVNLANLESKLSMLGGSASFSDTYGQIVSSVGTLTQSAGTIATSQETLLNQAKASREALAGVNLDEEAANLLKFQQAYQASAQSISIVKSLFDTLIAAVR